MRTGKRILSLLLLALLLAVLPSATHAAPPKGDTHVHNWSVTSSTAPTCTAAGSTTWTCSLCGQTYTEATPALGHSWDGGVTTAPTCTASGSTTWTCTRCGQTRTESTPALGHSWSGTIAQPPTCMEEGVKSYYCTRCGLTAAEILPKIDHDPVDVPALAPTCTEEGHTEGQSCSMCGLVMSGQEPIPALGHTWSAWATLTEASCTETGSEVRTCNVCGIEETRPVDALGHLPEALPAQAPTCTEEGLTEGVVCARCQAVLQAQEPVPALGHDWDEGAVTTEPVLFVPGVRTFTCQNDPSHTYTEEIDPAEKLFGTLRDGTVTFDLASNNPLIIVEDPVDGSITRYSDETHTMHVTAAGGTGEYTYAWHSQAQEVGQKEENNALLKWFLGLFGMSPEEVDEALSAPLSDTDTYSASTGDMEYWCVVTDSAGDSAVSDRAKVSYKLRIAQQPNNANIQGKDTVWLSCQAADGSGEYHYQWFYNDERDIPAYLHDECEVAEIGTYVCLVTDTVTGETIESEPCEVYSEEPFTLVSIGVSSKELWPEEVGSLSAVFKGGVGPYEVWWDKDGEAIPTSEGSSLNGLTAFYAQSTGAGKYTVHGVDAMGETATSFTVRRDRQLTITKQPEGGELPPDGCLPLSVQVEGGVSPYHYVLYRNNASYMGGDTDTLTAWHTGAYFIRIEDSLGHWIVSDTVRVTDMALRIKRQTKSASLSTPGETVQLEVEAEGGKAPYSYIWNYVRGDHWYTVGGDSPTTYAAQPGKYICSVTDAEHHEVGSEWIQVSYTGKAPWIIVQPVGGYLSRSGGSIRLTCEAISGIGGELKYDWYEINDKYNYEVPIASDTQSIDVSRARRYYCRVTDLDAHRITESDIVAVIAPMEITKCERVKGSDVRNGPLSDWTFTYKFYFTGGIGPFTVRIYEVWEHFDNGKAVLYKTFIVDDPAELNPFTIELNSYQTFDVLGSKEPRYKYGTYYIIVTDFAGQECRSPTVHYYNH